MNEILYSTWDDASISELPLETIALLAAMIDSGAYDDASTELRDRIFIFMIGICRNFEVPLEFSMRALKCFEDSCGIRKELWHNVIFCIEIPSIGDAFDKIRKENPSSYVQLSSAWVRPILRMMCTADDPKTPAMLIAAAYKHPDIAGVQDAFLSVLETARQEVGCPESLAYSEIPEIVSSAGTQH